MSSKFSKLTAAVFLAGCVSLATAACGGVELKNPPQPEKPLNSSGQNNQNSGGNQSNGNSGGSGNSNQIAPTPVATGTESGNAGGKLILSDTSKNETYPCQGREVELDDDTVANTINLTGECKKLTVKGVSNEVKVEKVGEIVVSGVSNKVYYGEGLNAKKPKISKSGTDTVVETIKAHEEKLKAAESK